MNRRAIVMIATVVVAAGLVGSAEHTLARFRDTDTAAATFGTRTLQPPTALAGTGGTSAALTWTPSTSGWGTGYQLLRSATSGSGYNQLGTIMPITAAATTDNPAAGTWYYVLRTYFQNWTSVRSNEATVTIGSPPTSTGFKNCVNTQADSGGDGNGYERNTGNACLQDGNNAQDRNSGTSTTNSCTSSGKDRHRFWGYAFALPGTVGSINGITVQARLGSNNVSGIVGVCVQVSWDGGANWSAAQLLPMTTGTMTTYTAGGASSTWGHAWTATQLSSSSFRVRLIDVSTNNTRRFDLDWVGVSVNYTP